MPPILIAFFILIGVTTGPPLIKGLDPRPDRIAHSKFGKPGKVEYRSWTSSPTRDKKGDCTFMIFALATRSAVHVLRVNGQELAPDWSWSWEAKVPNGMRGEGTVIEFLDPVTRAVRAHHEVSESCWTLGPSNQGGW